MPLKKQPNDFNEITIYDKALIYQRCEYWQMRVWLRVCRQIQWSGLLSSMACDKYIKLCNILHNFMLQ